MGKGETITAEAGALVFMKGDIEISTNMRSGFFKSVKVSFWEVNHFLSTTILPRKMDVFWA
ncbi:MAG: hypothetical protein QXW37_07490 [Candidatus Nitrosotenuis sp.]